MRVLCANRPGAGKKTRTMRSKKDSIVALKDCVVAYCSPPCIGNLRGDSQTARLTPDTEQRRRDGRLLLVNILKGWRTLVRKNQGAQVLVVECSTPSFDPEKRPEVTKELVALERAGVSGFVMALEARAPSDGPACCLDKKNTFAVLARGVHPADVRRAAGEFVAAFNDCSNLPTMGGVLRRENAAYCKAS